MSQQQHSSAQEELNQSRQEVNNLRETNNHIQSLLNENVALLVSHRADIDKQFENLCSQVIVNTQNTFLSLLDPVLSGFQQNASSNLNAQTVSLQGMLSPLEKSLQDISSHINSLEQARASAYEGMKEQITQLSQGHKDLYTETNALNMALRTPHIRGCWGEMQLRRVVELAGMSSYCDFQEQPTLQGEKNRLKPDMVIRLPGGKFIIVDAKAPLLHYLEAQSTKSSEEHTKKLKEHARTLASHVKLLSDKKYWSFQENSVEFTLLFLPGEAFLSSALEADPSLIESAAERQVILATPIILIALLKTIAYGWRQETFSQHTQLIISLGKDLYAKLEKFQNHMNHLGKTLKQSMHSYQEATSVLDLHIIPMAHQLGHISPDNTFLKPNVALSSK